VAAVASKSVINVKILGDEKGLTKSLGIAEGKVKSFGGAVGKMGIAAVAGFAALGAGAVVGLAKLGQSFDKEFDKIRVGTGATGEALTGLEDSFKTVLSSVPASFEDAGSAIADLNTRLGLTGKPLEDLSSQFINLSRITGTDLTGNIDKLTRVFGDWEINTGDQAESLDKVYRAAQASGIGIDELSSSVVEFGAPLRNLGFGFDDSLALLSQFNKTGVNTATVFAGLKAGVGKLAKAGEDVPATFARIVEEIEKMGPGSEATGLAIELFGQRAGPDLADAIAGGKFQIDEMLGAITGGTDTINAAAKDTESFGEKWTLIKNRVLVGLEPLATRVFTAIGEGMDKLGPIIDQVRVWFEANWPAIQVTIASFVTWFQTSALPVIRDIAVFIVDAFTTVAAWVDENWPKIQAKVAEFVDWFQSDVSPVIKKVADFVVKTFNQIKLWVDENWPAIRETIAGVIEAIRVTIARITAVITYIWEEHGAKLMAYADIVWKNLTAIIGAAIDIIRGIIDTVTSLIRGDWSGVWNGIKTILSGVWDAMKGIVNVAIGAIKLLITIGLSTIKTAWFAVWGAVASFIDDKWEAIKSTVKGGINSLVGFVTSLPGRITSGVAGAFDGIYNQFKGVINRVIDAWNGLRLPGFTIGGWDPPGPGPSFPSIRIPGVGTPTIPRLASGGLAFEPMLAVVGDNRNARLDPEVIAPSSMIAKIVRDELAASSGNRGGGEASVVINLMDRFQVEAIVSRRDADLLMSLEAGVR
jgi:TP901 family phage tail tape measure protein